MFLRKYIKKWTMYINYKYYSISQSRRVLLNACMYTTAKQTISPS